jgi:ABC-type polysaccharide/polyol phosphate transport system ATPase subunit
VTVQDAAPSVALAEVAASISVEDVGKVYHLYAKPIHRLFEALHPLRRKYHKDFHALRRLSFEVGRGETIGIVGKNGSGKSTLLKIITGVLTPTTGRVHTRGRISALLELGMGFNPEITGIENVFFSGAILGIPEHDMREKLPDILEFADIGDYAGQPVKTYSSGMFVRLAFAVAIHVDPEILIVDEALSVGDMRFQQKCFRKIRSFKERGITILFVSHDTGAILSFCDRCLWIKDGKIERDGAPAEVVREYVAHMAFDSATSEAAIGDGRAADARTEWTDTASFSSFGDRGVEIARVALVHESSRKPIHVLTGGEDVVYMLELVFHRDVADVIYGVIVKDAYGKQIIGFNSFLYGHSPAPRHAGERVQVSFAFRFPRLKNGDYTLSPAVAEGTQESHIEHHWVHDATVVQVARNDPRHKLDHWLVLDEVGFDEQPAHTISRAGSA